MREHGERHELVRMRPHDHIGWVFAGPADFAMLALPFLAEGASRQERLMYIAEDPDPADMAQLAETVPPGTLEIASIAEVYGTDGMVDASAQRATFAGALSMALSEGYTGIRVAADNTPLVMDPDRLRAWITWEIVADHFMSENPVTGLCAFDRERIDIDELRHLATLHPLSPADCAVPQFRLFTDSGALLVEGEVDAFALENVWLALGQLPPKTSLIVDLSKTAMVTRAVMSGLRKLCDDGVGVTVRGATRAARQVGDRVGMPPQAFALVDA